MTGPEALAAVQTWLDDQVIGLDLCPFARAPRRADTVWFSHSDATNPDDLIADAGIELAALAELSEAERSTTLLLASHLTDLAAFQEAVGGVEALIDAAGVEELFQVVGFHPEAVYDGADPDDPANDAARAPVPVIHLLRADMVERAVHDHPDAAGISERNAELLRSRAGWSPGR